METQEMSPKNNEENYKGENSNIKFYAILIAVVLIVGIVVLAWVLKDDEKDDPYKNSLNPISVPYSDFSFNLPSDIKFCLEFYEDRFYVKDFGVLENCAVKLDNWWRWETEENKFGYREYRESILLVGPVQIFNLTGQSINVGTQPVTSQ